VCWLKPWRLTSEREWGKGGGGKEGGVLLLMDALVIQSKRRAGPKAKGGDRERVVVGTDYCKGFRWHHMFWA
jgi:hypothetical protein